MLLITSILSIPPIAFAQAGSLDPTFAVGGIVRTTASSPGGQSSGFSVAVQPDGKVVVLASRDNYITKTFQRQFD